MKKILRRASLWTAALLMLLLAMKAVGQEVHPQLRREVTMICCFTCPSTPAQNSRPSPGSLSLLFMASNTHVFSGVSARQCAQSFCARCRKNEGELQ